MTLRQLLRQCHGTLPACRIDDAPDFLARGVMLDISRDKVPTLETLFNLIDELAEWKINHLELYTEHTFAYRNHREVWAQASPLTSEDILRLDAYCRDRFVELVPNQNSFSHLHRWLELPRYRNLAECPDGFDHKWGKFGPFSLNPSDPGSIKLVEEMYDDLLANFTSRKFNVGCDETFDLGLGKSKALCEKKGKSRVYLDFVLKVYNLVKKHGRTMHFWGDIVMEHPELVPEIPKDIVALEWGYEANHPFKKHGTIFKNSGLSYYVCPGTSSWCAFAGRTDNCLGNLRSAAINGLKNGAIGFLNTDWGDNGHLQYLPMSYLGFAAGAALSWCVNQNKDEDFVAAMDLHVFHDSASVMGRLSYDLGNTYKHVGFLDFNGDYLFTMLWKPEKSLEKGVTEKTLKVTREYIESTLASLASARMHRGDRQVISDEFTNAARMMIHACHRGMAIRQGKAERQSTRDELALEVREILGMHREVWMARNRVGGIQDGTRILDRLLREYTNVLP
jgi:hypothetical protein